MMQFTIAVGSFKNGNMKHKHWKKYYLKNQNLFWNKKKHLKDLAFKN